MRVRTSGLPPRPPILLSNFCWAYLHEMCLLFRLRSLICNSSSTSHAWECVQIVQVLEIINTDALVQPRKSLTHKVHIKYSMRRIGRCWLFLPQFMPPVLLVIRPTFLFDVFRRSTLAGIQSKSQASSYFQYSRRWDSSSFLACPTWHHLQGMRHLARIDMFSVLSEICDRVHH